jgi:hypothetical protein
LARGDIFANADALATQAHTPTDPVGAKIQALARVGYTRKLLVIALELVRDIHWSTTAVEHGRACASCLRRLHKEYSPEMIAQRALVHMARRLFLVEVESRHATRVQRLIRKASMQHPEKSTGRHVFLKDADESVKALSGGKLEAGFKKHMMAEHGPVHKLQSLALQRQYERRAVALADQQRDAMPDEFQRLASERTLWERRSLEEAEERGVVLRDSSCRFSDDDVATMQALWQDHRFTYASVER